MPRLPLSVVLVLGLSGLVVAADQSSLLRFVGDDAGLCLEVTGGRESLERIWSGELATRFRKTSVYRQWLDGRDYANLTEARTAVEKAVGQPLDLFAGNLLGDDVVVALFPGTTGRPESLLLARAADENVLTEAISIWNRIEPAQETVSLRHRDREYRRRTHRGRTVFHVTMGSLFAISEQEGRIREVLDLAANTDATGSLLATDRYRTARSEVPADVTAIAYVNPRLWDAVLPEPKDDGERIVRSLFDRAESIVLSLRTDSGLVLDAVVQYTAGDSDDRWQQYVEQIGGTGAFLDHVPSRSLYVGFGRIDVAGIVREVYANVSEEDRKRAEPWRRFVAQRFLNGLDPLDDVLPVVGPEWGGYVVPRAELTTGAMPVEGLLAVELPKPGSETELDAPRVAEARKALDTLLSSGLEFWVAIHNSRVADAHAVVKSEEENGLRRHWIEGLGSHRPSYAITPGFVLMATDPDLLSEFLAPVEGQQLTRTPEFVELRKQYFPDSNQLLYLNVGEVRRFVASNRDFLFTRLTRRRDDEAVNAAPRTVRLEEFLGLVDDVFLAGSVTGNRVRLVFGAVAE